MKRSPLPECGRKEVAMCNRKFEMTTEERVSVARMYISQYGAQVLGEDLEQEIYLAALECRGDFREVLSACEESHDAYVARITRRRSVEESLEGFYRGQRITDAGYIELASASRRRSR